MSFETINTINRDFERYYNNGQLKEAVATYANDARVFADNKQIYQGLDQIEKFYSDARNNGNTKVNLHTEQVIQCSSDYTIEIRFRFY
jgi:ketosteroid isomerase-like protein